MIFIDNTLARKTQDTNAENFSGFTITGDAIGVNYSQITMTYIDKNFPIRIGLNVSCALLVNTTNFQNLLIDINNEYRQGYIVNNISNYQINDLIEVCFYYDIITSSSVTFAYGNINTQIGEVYYHSGVTINNNIYELTGYTTQVGINYFYNIPWSLQERIGVLKYNTYIRQINGNLILVDKILEDYTYNDLIKMADKVTNSGSTFYYNILDINCSDRNYNSVASVIKKSIFGNYLDINKKINSIKINPKRNENDIYFNYDYFCMSFNGSNSPLYIFTTNNIYNKYSLNKLILQTTFSGNSMIYYDYLCTVNYNTYNGSTLFDINVNLSGSSFYRPYTFVNIITNIGNYVALLTSITGNTFTLFMPLRINIGEHIITINNLYTISDISDMLNACYLNINGNNYLYISKLLCFSYINNINSNITDIADYRKLDINIIKNVYESYYHILDDLDINLKMRGIMTGVLFENINNDFVLKVFNPGITTDQRFLYEPVELVRIGKDRKTSIPFKVNV
jgi:hypothetical protein